MLRTINVNVTERDIKLGNKRDFCGCPIARAVKRATNFKKKVSVFNTVVSLENEAGTLPKVAQNFIEKFDTKQPVKPFSFKLEIC